MGGQNRAAFFHEDDYCQCEILPLTAKGFCMRQMGEIDAFAQEHRMGVGFTDMLVREDSPHKLEELALRPEQLHDALGFLTPYDRVVTGYSSCQVDCKSTCCRGDGPGQNVFWSLNGTGLIDAVWLDLWITPATKERWSNILAALGRMAPVLLADWEWSRCVDLTSANEISRYAEEKAEA